MKPPELLVKKTWMDEATCIGLCFKQLPTAVQLNTVFLVLLSRKLIGLKTVAAFFPSNKHFSFCHLL